MKPRPLASSGLSDLAASWEKELSESASTAEREERRARLVQLYLQIIGTDGAASVRRDFAHRLLSLNAASPVGTSVLETLAEVTHDDGDTDIYRRVLEVLANDDDAEVKTRALEKLGDLFADLGDRRAAIDSWKPAAEIRQSRPALQGQARRLYERVLDTLPDGDAAERLVMLYADENDWDRIPEALGVVIRTNVERGAEVVLALERSARIAGALDKFVSMADEAMVLQTPSSATARRLRLAKARALAGDPARREEASATYRALIEAFGEDEDRREYQAFIDRGGSRWERRWLHQWRAKHEAQPFAALVEWAKDEEESGELEEAVVVYRRALDAAPETERAALALKLACILEELGRVEEALVLLAPLLSVEPKHRAAHEIARLILADRTSGQLAADRLEGMANEADAAVGARLFAFLVESREETASMPAARRRWYRRALEVPSPALDLAEILRGALEMPDEPLVWDAAERAGRETGDLAAVARAYAEALESEADPELAETLGRRLLALEEECGSPAFIVEALERVLLRAPRARWALDRVKLALAGQGAWERLFSFYDRALGADGDRALLEEAATLARDLADDADRAIGYFARIHAIAPEDLGIATALERLYERQDRKTDLIALLSERKAEPRRIASLWLDLGNADAASAVLEEMLEAGTSVIDVIDLLERVAAHPGQTRATGTLSAHYAGKGEIGEVVRLAEQALRLTPCAARMRELVDARILAAQGSVAGAMERIDADVAEYPALARVAYRAALREANKRRKHAATDAEFEDALSGAWLAIERARGTYDARGASRFLERAARLPFELGGRRVLLHHAARLSSELPDDRDRTIRLLTELFHENGADDIARSMLGRFAELLEAAGKHAKLASVWEDQAAHQDDEAEARAFWLRAAAIWEKLEDVEKTIAANERAAALGAREAYETLARLYSERAEWAKAAGALEWLSAVDASFTLRLVTAYVEIGERDKARARLEAMEPGREVRTRLIALYREDEMWTRLVEALIAEAAEDPAARAALLAEASDVRARLGEPAEAARLLEQAVAAAPEDANLRPKLADLFEALGEWPKVATVLFEQTALYGERRSKDRALLHHRLAKVLQRLGREDDALVELQHAAKMHPTDAAILRDLAETSFARGDLDLAERTYRALLLALRSTPAVSPTKVLLDLGTIAVKKGDTARAANLLESGLDAALEHAEDSSAFEHALGALGRHDLVVRAAEARVVRASNENVRAQALRELADLWREHLGREAVLGARIRAYAGQIERALDKDAWPALWAIHVALGDEPALLAMIRERLDEGPRTGAWLHEAAGVALRAEHLELAAEVYGALLEDDARDREAWAGVARLVGRLEDPSAFTPQLERALAKVEAPPERARMRIELARILTERDRDAAVRLLSGALDDDPKSVEAVELVTSILERDGRHAELAALLERRLAALGSEYTGAVWQLGRTLERAGRKDEASRLYESILDRAPKDLETVRTIAERLEALGSPRLADCVEAWMDLDAAAAKELAPRLVTLRDALKDDAATERALERALSLCPTDRAFLDRLVRLHEEAWDWAAVTRVLRTAYDAAPSDRKLLLRLVDAYRAMGTEQEILVLLGDANDPELLVLRARAREAVGDDKGAIEDIRKVGAAHVDAVADILGRIVSRAAPADADGYAMLLVETFERAKRIDDARRELVALLARNPDHAGAVEKLARLDAAAGQWDRAAEAYARLVKIVVRSGDRDPRALPRAVVAFADACHRAGRPESAKKTLERAWLIQPEDPDIAEWLERVCEASGDNARLGELVAARAARTSDGREKAKLLLRAAGLSESPVAFLEQARVADPENIEVALAYARAEMARNRPREATLPLIEVVDKSKGKRSPLIAAVHLELAKAHLAVDELAEAFDALKAGFAIDLRNGELAMLTGLVALDLGDEKTAERALLAAATMPRKDDGPAVDRAGALFHLASMAIAQRDGIRARRFIEKALAEDAAHPGALELRERLGAESERPSRKAAR